MRRVPFIAALLLVFGGLVALLGLLFKHELGSFAANPQMIEVPIGTRRIAGGGRALVAAREVSDDGVSLVISCRDQSAETALTVGDMSDPVCGVTITYLTPRGREGDRDDPLRSVLEVRWEE